MAHAVLLAATYASNAFALDAFASHFKILTSASSSFFVYVLGASAANFSKKGNIALAHER